MTTSCITEIMCTKIIYRHTGTSMNRQTSLSDEISFQQHHRTKELKKKKKKTFWEFTKTIFGISTIQKSGVSKNFFFCLDPLK